MPEALLSKYKKYSRVLTASHPHFSICPLIMVANKPETPLMEACQKHVKNQRLTTNPGDLFRPMSRRDLLAPASVGSDVYRCRGQARGHQAPPHPQARQAIQFLKVSGLRPWSLGQAQNQLRHSDACICPCVLRPVKQLVTTLCPGKQPHEFHH